MIINNQTRQIPDGTLSISMSKVSLENPLVVSIPQAGNNQVVTDTCTTPPAGGTILYFCRDQPTKAKPDVADLKVSEQQSKRRTRQVQLQCPLEDIPPGMNTWTPKLQITKDHLLKGNYCIRGPQWIKYKSSDSKEEVEEVSLEEDHEDKIMSTCLVN